MTKKEAELIIKEQDKSTKEILKAIEKEKCELLGIIQGKDTVIHKLKQENEKLKIDYDVLSCSVDDFGELQNKFEEEQRKNNGLSDKLTKAVLIIKNLLHLWEDVMTEDTVKSMIKEAKRFLKEAANAE